MRSVNTNQVYHEQTHVDAGVETSDIEKLVEGALPRVFPKLDRVAFGLSVGITAGILLFLATFTLVLKGGDVIGPNLQLLGQYFPGYSVTPSGSILGLAYGFLTGFVGGWGFAFLSNAAVFLYMATLLRRAELQLLRNLLDYL